MALGLVLAATSDDRKASFRSMFGTQVAAHGPAQVEAIIQRAGFAPPTQCFQSALVRGWVAPKT